MKHLVSAAALALSLAACGPRGGVSQNDAESAANLTSPPDGEDAAATTEVMMNGTAVSTPITASDFANQAASADQFEIRSAQLAATKAGSAAVKSFAATLAQHHAKSTSDLTAAAAQGVPPTTPAAALSPEQQANLDALNKAPNGAEFDRLFAQLQVPAHENALALMQGYAVRGDQPRLKQFASQAVPMIQRHLEQARGLAR